MPPSPTSRRPRVALIGVSGYGTIYVQLIREALARGAIELASAVVINRDQVPEVAAELEAAGATIYPDSETFFAREAGRVDLCLIPVGIPWHARLTIAALRAGMNVLVEKPLAGSVADAEAILAAEAATGRWVAVGFQDLYATETRWLKSRLLAGAIGRVEEIRLLGLWPRPRDYFSRNGWAGRIEADGAAVLDSPLNNAFAHFVNLALFFAGTAPAASASLIVESAELHRAHAIEMFDTAVVRGATPRGVRVWLGVSHSAGITREPELLIRGSSGFARWRHDQDCLLRDFSGAAELRLHPGTTHTRREMFAAALARCADPAVFVCGAALAANHTRAIEAVQAAARVRDFPAEAVDWPATSPDLPVVRGLAEALDRAFAEGSALAYSPPPAPLLAAHP